MRFKVSKVPVSMSDKKKSYYKYYAQPIYGGPSERYEQIKKGPSDNKDALHITKRNDLFKLGNLPSEFGYWLMDDGSALIANSTFFPNTTGEMFDWWFVWHGIDRLRYAIWDNEDHYDVQLEDYKKALDLSLSMRERHWGSVHHIWEDIGLGTFDKLIIRFKNPASFGYDVDKIGTEACNSLVCANVDVLGDDTRPDVPVVMTHFLRPCKGGSELRSRFWFGWHIINGEPVKLIPDSVKIPDTAPIALLGHNVKEFSNLARILPLVYAEEKDNW